MSVQVNNIITGPGDLFIAERDGGNFPALPAFDTPSGTAYDAFDDASAWTYLGATEGGVELSYEPTYGDIEIDQFLDAAKLRLENQTYNVTTQLMEATLANLIYVWGYDTDTHLDVTAGESAEGIQSTFKMGVLESDPCEYAVSVVSRGVGDQPNCVPGTKVERVYVARRIVSAEGSPINMNKTESTMFQVNFRLLPDTSAPDNEQYGKIFDRDPTKATG